MINTESQAFGVLLGAGLTAGGFGIRAIWKWKRRPIFEMTAKSENGFLSINPILCDRTHDLDDKGNYARILIRNVGSDPANGTAVFLNRIECWNGRWVNTEYHDNLRLNWSHRGGEPMQLLSGIDYWLDLCYARSDRPNIFLPMSPVAFRYREGFPAGLYRFTVQVTAENASPASMQFAVLYLDDWQRIELGDAAQTPNPQKILENRTMFPSH